MGRLLLVVVIMGASGFSPTLAATLQADVRETTVGVAAAMKQVVIPGPQLEAKPIDADAPFVLRVIEVYPHGTDFRYDFEYYGLEPGSYDLLDWLQQADGTPAEGDPIEVTVTSVLPPGQVLPHEPEEGVLPSIGGYRTLLTLGAVVWVLGLFAILFWRRGGHAAGGSAARRPMTLAERLRPLLEEAMAGRLPQDRHSELEMTLVAWWRRRLKMDDLPAAESITRLRQHDDAGPLLRQLESWLHQPTDRRDQADLADLLRPYESLPATALDAGATP